MRRVASRLVLLVEGLPSQYWLGVCFAAVMVPAGVRFSRDHCNPNTHPSGERIFYTPGVIPLDHLSKG